MQPWEHPIPPVLYKYMPPERFHVLSDCRVRFSQRTAFEDDHELQPDYAAFGTDSEIQRFVICKGLKQDSRIDTQTPQWQATAMQTALKVVEESVNKLAVFCLTETADCQRMWEGYANNGRGFAIAFDTAHAGFEQLKTPGKFGMVSYNYQSFGTVLRTLETEGFAALFRKRMKYAFEREWRGIRGLRRLELHPGNVFLSPFDPACIHTIVIRPACTVETELRRHVGTDARYRHVRIEVETVHRA
jgi:hypothetical protein